MKIKRPKPRVLLFGFSSFADIRENPSAVVVNRLKEKARDVRITAAVLETSYADTDKRLLELLKGGNYDLVLGFGTAAFEDRFRLETTARNRAGTKIPDVRGRKKRTARISKNGPDVLESCFDFARMAAALRQYKIPFRLSTDAGDYLCNYAYYKTLLFLRRKGKVPSLFIHIPLHRKEAKARRLTCPAMPLKTILKGAEVCFRAALHHLPVRNL